MSAVPTVLIVDESQTAAEELAACLQRAPARWTVTIALGMAAARASLSRDLPSLLLVDAELEGPNATPFCAPDGPACPVVLLSAHNDAAHAVRALKAGATNFLVRADALAADLPALLDQARREWESARQTRNADTPVHLEHARLAHLVDSTHLGTWEWNVCTGQIHLNAHWAEMLGYSLTELTSVDLARWLGFIHPDDLAQSRRALDRHLAGESPSYRCECRLLHRSGRWIWVLARGQVLTRTPDGLPQLMFGTHSDITTLKHADFTLRQNGTWLHRAERLASFGTWEMNVATHEVDCSAHAREIYGLAQEAPSLDLIRSVPLPSYRPALDRAMQSLIAHGHPYDIEFEIQRPSDGAHAFIHSVAEYDAATQTLFGVIHDVTERQLARTALQESAYFLQKAHEVARLGSYKFDLESGRWTGSPQLDEILGLDPSYPRDLDGWIRLVAPSHRAEMAAYMRDHVVGARQCFDREYPVLRASDRQERWVSGLGELECDAAGRPRVLIGTIQDITDRHLANQALRLSEERFRHILQNVQFVAIQGYAPDGTALYWNRASESLYGYTAKEAIGRNLLDLIIPEPMRDEVRSALAQMAATGQPSPSGELTLLRRDGSPVSVFSSRVIIRITGRPQELFCIDIDLTESKRSRSLLELQSHALNVAANAIVITDRDGRIEWINAAFTAITGYSPAESVGRTPGHLLRSSHHEPAFYRKMWTTILAGQVWHGELLNRRKDGRLFTEEMTITPIRDESGAVARFIAVKQDISQRKLLEGQFRQAQKMEAIGQLAGGVAHDFNNILAAVLMHLGLIQEDEALAPAMRASLKELTREIQRGASLTRQLLTFSRQQAMEPQRLDLHHVVNGLLKMLRRLLGENIAITLRATPGECPVEADSGMLEQVVINLCINARDAMPRGGKLAIALAPHTVADATEALPNGPRPGRFACLTISDTGCGMSDDTLRHIFEPFFTTKDAGRGTGLGLATVYGIVQQHQGWIAVDSTLGAGTSFHVYLPLSDAPDSATLEPALPAAPRGRGETILLAEDETNLRTTIALTLQHSGYRVLEAANGVVAEQLWHAHSGRIDLLLTDMVMPGNLSGLELIQRLRAARPDLKVIACTGYEKDNILTQFPPDDPIPMLRKPYDRAQLLAAVHARLAQL